MAPPKQNNGPVMDALPPADRVTLANLETYKTLITCPKCIEKGTITYTGNTTTSNPHPLFSCTACKQQISLSSLQHEITQAKASGAIPIQVPYPTPAAPSTTLSKKAAQPKKRTRVESDDTVEMTRSKSTPTKNSNNSNNNNVSPSILETLKVVQQQLEEIKKENAQMKQQIQSANERNSQLEKKILSLTKNEMLSDLHQQQQQQQNQQQNDYSTRMEEDTESFPPLPNNNKGSSASKYAHEYNPTMQDKIRNTNLMEKNKK